MDVVLASSAQEIAVALASKTKRNNNLFIFLQPWKMFKYSVKMLHGMAFGSSSSLDRATGQQMATIVVAGTADQSKTAGDCISLIQKGARPPARPPVPPGRRQMYIYIYIYV